jgi:hypothetical protein
MEIQDEVNKISQKNLGTLLGTLEAMNVSQAVIGVVKSFFWKNSDEIANKIKEGR